MIANPSFESLLPIFLGDNPQHIVGVRQVDGLTAMDGETAFAFLDWLVEEEHADAGTAAYYKSVLLEFMETAGDIQ